jgi:hypothetical protein
MESVQFNFKLINKKKLKTASGEKRRGNLLSELSRFFRFFSRLLLKLKRLSVSFSPVIEQIGSLCVQKSSLRIIVTLLKTSIKW